MQLHPAALPIPEAAKGAAIALGNFDGVHAGHRAVIEAARGAATARQCAFGIAVFEPHPRRFFQPDAPPFRLQSPAQRARTLDHLGVEHLFEVGFDAALAHMSDRDFVEQVLVNHLGAAHVCVGADFRFGRGRMGDMESLKQLGKACGFGVEGVAAVEHGGAKYSSSAIRAALAGGDVRTAAALLGRPWAVQGEVVRGFARGRGFGFPTANIALGDYVRPRLGIYAVRARIDGAAHDGVASVGVNPSVGALAEPVLEAHLFDFGRDLYGQTIEIAFAAFLRDEAKFDTIEALTAQMARDAVAAREALAKA